MSDSQFDDFAKGRLGDHEVPVPGDLWDKIADGQFDQVIGDKLKDASADVSPGLWDKISDAQFDGFVSGALSGAEAAVPAGFWEKINDGQFDGFVKDTLADASAPVPAGLWEKIMPEEEDDKGGYIWFRNATRIAAIFLLVAGLAIGSYYWHRASQKQEASLRKVDSAGQQTPSLRTDNSTVPTVPANNESIDQLNGNSTKQAEASTSDQPGHIRAGADPSVDHTDRLATDNTTAGQNDKRTNNDRLHAVDEENRSSNELNGIRSTTTQTNDRGTQTTAQMPLGFPDPYQLMQLSKGATIPQVMIQEGISPQDKKLSLGNHASLFNSIVICPTGRTGNTDWYLEAYASPDISFRSFSNNTATQQYIGRKDSSESMRPGFSAGIRLVKPITDNILVKAGLQYSQINQKYVYRTENEIKNITVVTTRTIIRAPGDTLVISDTSTMQQIGFRSSAVINRFRTLDVPVTVGYQFGNEDLKIGVNAGVIVNVSSWYQGVMLDSSLATVPIQKGSNMVYKSNIGLGLYGGVSIVKRLSDDLHVFAEPYFRYNLSNMTAPNAAYNQKFSIGGISLGVRLNLNRQ